MSANLTPDVSIERNRPGKSAGVKNAPAGICQCFFVCAFSNVVTCASNQAARGRGGLAHAIFP